MVLAKRALKQLPDRFGYEIMKNPMSFNSAVFKGLLSLSSQIASRLLLLFLLALFTALPNSARAADEEEGVRVNPHNYNKREYCSYCHKTDQLSLNFDPVTTCTKCHSGNVDNHPITRHPIGKVPRINIPKVLPLTKEGQLVCYTCHDPHNRTRNQNMLRVDYNRLCALCHVGY